MLKFNNESVAGIGPDGTVQLRSGGASDFEAAASMWLSGADTGTNKTGRVSETTAFERQSWVFSCVTTISRTASDVPLQIRSRAGDRVFSRGPAYDLFRRPSPRGTLRDLLYRTFQDLELSGNAIWWIEFNGSRNAPKPIGLHRLNPRRVRPVVDKKSGSLRGYTYMVPGGKDVPFALDEVLHFQYPNPNDEFWGLAPLRAAMMAVHTDIKAESYNHNFFDNSAVPSALLIHKRALGKQQRDQVKQSFMEEYGGVDRAHKLALLAGEWDLKTLGLGHKDMEFLSIRSFSREQIGSVFGVPGVLMNDPNRSNYSTASVELRIFAESNWLPKLRSIVEIINAQVFSYYWPEQKLVANASDAPGLREDMGEKVKRSQVLFKIGVPLNDIIRMLDLPMDPKVWGDDWWVPQNLARASQMLTAGTDETPDGGNPPVDDPSSQEPPPDEQKQMREDFWRLFSEESEPMEKAFAKKLRAHLANLRRQAVSACHRAADIPFDLAQANDSLVSWVGEETERAFIAGVEMASEEVGADSPDIGDFRCPTSGVTDLNDTLHEFMSAISVDDEDRGQKMRSLVDELQEKSRLIARSQIGAAVNLGRMYAMRALGYNAHTWVSSRGKGGGLCHENDGETVVIGQEFSNGFAYPLQSDGIDGLEAMACRCTTVAARE